ncbi:MAG: preprotein translocase subunit SecG [Alphaproteobacteria bacterium]|nr:MAG: preprotein translocase subunit SecG [Alphaproteobacteria bacterium]
MFTVFLIIQIMIIIAMVAVILLQRSEGGALGMGGGGGMGGLMTGRGAANLLTRTTAFLAAGFFVTSIILTVLARTQDDGALQFDENDLIPPLETTLPDTETTPPVVLDGSVGEDAAGSDATPVLDPDAIDAGAEDASEPSDDAVENGAPVVPDSE